MKPPAIRRSSIDGRSRERGVTMVLVAIAMVAIIAMAALSIDVVTLYLAKVEAQRSADAAALAGARIIALSGLTGAPGNQAGAWASICGAGPTSPSTQAAKAVAIQGTIGSVAPTVIVTYSAGGTSGADCSTLPAAFGVNPMVTVTVTRAGLPTFFSRIWGNTGNSVSATATAEAYNASNSGNVGNAVTGTITPVTPRCVKPWMVPNRDPNNPGKDGSGVWCDNVDAGAPNSCNTFVNVNDGSITNPGISLNGTETNGVIGERFWLTQDCRHAGSTCVLRPSLSGSPTPQANYYPNTGVRSFIQQPPNLQYLPGEAPAATPHAIPSCSVGSAYEEAVGGCDESTVYQCGVPIAGNPNPNKIDLAVNPGQGTNDNENAITCLIHEGDATDTQPDGQDTLDYTAYPFKVLAGGSNPLLGSANPVTSSPSVVSLPIYDSAAVTVNGSGTTDVTIVGFLQVFINSVDQWGNVDVTVLNVAGCSNGGGPDPVGNPVKGSSPVPVRLVTPP